MIEPDSVQGVDMLIYGRVCLVARARDCKSPTKKHRRFDSYLSHHFLRRILILEEHIIYKQIEEPLKISLTDRDIEDWINSCYDIKTLEYLAYRIKNHISFLKDPKEYYKYEDYVK